MTLLYVAIGCGDSSGPGEPSGHAGANAMAGANSAGEAGAASSMGGGGSAGDTAGSGMSSGGTETTPGGASAGGSSGMSAGGSPDAGNAGTTAGGQSGNAGTGTGGAGPTVSVCPEMVQAANEFLVELGDDPTLRALALMAFEQRTHYKFTPGERPGVPLRDLNERQRDLALALLATGLSENGFTKAEVTRQNELVLRAQENSNSRDPLGYFLAIYGTPASDGTWAWHWEGHHLSLHFTLADCTRAATAPTFYGANPASVTTSVAGGPPAGTRNLGREEDLARTLAEALAMDATKANQAIVASQSRDTPETTRVMDLEPRGLAATSLNASERDMLRAIITEYANNLAPELAAERLSRVQDGGLDSVSFLWSGSLMPGQAHYYRITGPTFLIEYVNEQNNANHVHAAWRDFDGDYGRDLIQEHRLSSPH